MYVLKKIFQIGMGALVLTLLSAGISFAGWGPGYGMYPGGHMMGFGYMGWTMLLFWGVLLVVLILVIRWILRLTQSDGPGQTALDILKKRLANGEIDIEEFKEKRSLL